MPPHRKRLRRYEQVGQARFLTFSCHDRLPLLGNPAIRDAFVEQLTVVHGKGACEFLAWVVMPDHVHLVCVPSLPDWPAEKLLKAIKQPFAQRVLLRWRHMNAPILNRIITVGGHTRFWLRGGGYDRNVDINGELIEKINYIHANPVRRGLVRLPADWKWSSARWYEGDHAFGPPIATELLSG